jgi:DNA-binding NarL/FixJ family response regulator
MVSQPAVFVVDDDAGALRSLSWLIRPADLPVRAFPSGREFLDACSPEQAGCLILDLRMPEMDGLSVLRRLAEPGRAPHFIILTTFDDADVLFEGCKAGARGFLLKDVSLEQLASTISAVAEGRLVLQPSITETLLRNIKGRAESRLDDEFAEPVTERERGVIRLMAGGFSNREIGEMLGLTEGTVKNHVSRLLLKLDARDRTSAVLKAIASRLA